MIGHSTTPHTISTRSLTGISPISRLVETSYITTLLGNPVITLIDAPKICCSVLPFNHLQRTAQIPHQAPLKYLERYRNIAEPSPRAYAGSITAMDGRIGRVLVELTTKRMHDNTNIIPSRYNGDTRNAIFAGEGDMSKICDPLR